MSRERDARDAAVSEAAALAEGFTLEALLRDVEVDPEQRQQKVQCPPVRGYAQAGAAL